MASPISKAFLEPGKAIAYLYFYLHCYALILCRGRRFIRFTGQLPRRAYSIWKTCRLLGLTPSLTRGEPVYHHVDLTVCEPAPVAAINGRCRDVSKTTVGRIFGEVFGYPLLIDDPRAYPGHLVAKSERNASHDGVILQGPVAEPPAHLCYQREIDNRLDSGEIVDLRTAVVGDEIAAVVLKIRGDRPGLRFDSSATSRAVLREAGDVFSPWERQRILAFCRRIALDFGELDVLRDRADGRIYIVDASKTAHTPSAALPVRDRIALMKRLARSFERQFCRPANATHRQSVQSRGGLEEVGRGS